LTPRHHQRNRRAGEPPYCPLPPHLRTVPAALHGFLIEDYSPKRKPGRSFMRTGPSDDMGRRQGGRQQTGPIAKAILGSIAKDNPGLPRLERAMRLEPREKATLELIGADRSGLPLGKAAGPLDRDNGAGGAEKRGEENDPV